MENLILSHNGQSVSWNDLPESSKRALVTLGFSTKIKNAIAGVKAGVLGTGKTPWSEEDIVAEAEAFGASDLIAQYSLRSEAVAAAICDAKQTEMFEAIAKGIEPRTRGGARMSDDEKLRQAIAIETLVAVAKAKGKALPKRSKPEEREAFDALLAKALENPKFVATVDKEFNERKRKALKQADALDDLFG